LRHPYAEASQLTEQDHRVIITKGIDTRRNIPRAFLLYNGYYKDKRSYITAIRSIFPTTKQNLQTIWEIFTFGEMRGIFRPPLESGRSNERSLHSQKY
jgi:hypothetical protein